MTRTIETIRAKWEILDSGLIIPYIKPEPKRYFKTGYPYGIDIIEMMRDAFRNRKHVSDSE
jgi:hypothetical protein